jgi:hypothetical protein
MQKLRNRCKISKSGWGTDHVAHRDCKLSMRLLRRGLRRRLHRRRAPKTPAGRSGRQVLLLRWGRRRCPRLLRRRRRLPRMLRLRGLAPSLLQPGGRGSGGAAGGRCGKCGLGLRRAGAVPCAWGRHGRELLGLILMVGLVLNLDLSLRLIGFRVLHLGGVRSEPRVRQQGFQLIAQLCVEKEELGC